jgi:hypothetical protein
MIGDRARDAFPTRERQIIYLCTTSSVFADLCADYAEVAEVLARLGESRGSSRLELEQLESQLRQEIANALEIVHDEPGPRHPDEE